jgi:hypothetical protein
MEANRKRIFRIVIPVLCAGGAAMLLFALTGVLRDPALTEPQPEPAKVSQQASTTPPPTAAVTPTTTPDAGKAPETVAKADDKDAFPDFDEEPSGS